MDNNSRTDVNDAIIETDIMETIIREISSNEEENKKIYDEAAEVLRTGGLVAFPTETVYGLGGNALDKNASKKIYEAKGRPSDNPLIVHIAEMEDLEALACDVPEKAYLLAGKFWPGPLTMIFRKKDCVPTETTGGRDTVAVRMPAHRTARGLLKNTGLYIAAPSANVSGRPSPTEARYVIEDLSGRIDMVIADDTVDVGVESSIVDMTSNPPMLLRPGDITVEDIESVIGQITIDPTVLGILNGVQTKEPPKAPGMKYGHYAPDAPLYLIEDEDDRGGEKVIEKIKTLASKAKAEGKLCAVLTTEENKAEYAGIIDREDMIVAAGRREDIRSVESEIFRALRRFNDLKPDIIFSETFSPKGRGMAVMNRLIKAARNNIIRI